MTRGVGGESPANVEKHLKGVSYPASKQDLIKAAERNEAPSEIIEVLEELPRDEFNGPQDVMKAYGQIK